MTDSSRGTRPILAAVAKLPRERSAKTKSVPAFRFCAEGRLALDALAVEVDGFGGLRCPVPPEKAAALHAASTPARHGLREATLLDKRVRDTCETGPGALILRWTEGSLPTLMAEVARELGLPGARCAPAQPAGLRPGTVLQAASGHRKAPRHGCHAGAGVALGAHRRRTAGAAEALGLTVHLALAEIHQQWTANVPYHRRRAARASLSPMN